MDLDKYFTDRYDRERKQNGFFCKAKHIRTEADLLEEAKRFKKSLKVLTGTTNYYSVLDYGCGVGHFSQVWKPKQYTGVDIVKQLKDDNEWRYPKYKFKFMTDITDITGFYDLIFSSGVFQHLKEPETRDILKWLAKCCNTMVVYFPPQSVDQFLHPEPSEKTGAPLTIRPVDFAIIFQDYFKVKAIMDRGCKIWGVPL